jgi:hypothetical protein
MRKTNHDQITEGLTGEESEELDSWEASIRSVQTSDPVVQLQIEEALSAIDAARSGSVMISDAEISALTALLAESRWIHAPPPDSVDAYRRAARLLRGESVH